MEKKKGLDFSPFHISYNVKGEKVREELCVSERRGWFKKVCTEEGEIENKR